MTRSQKIASERRARVPQLVRLLHQRVECCRKLASVRRTRITRVNIYLYTNKSCYSFFFLLVKPKKKPQKYLPEWESKLDWLDPDKKTEFSGFCDFCKVEIKCNGGITDLQSHAKTNKHITRAAERKSNAQKKLTPFVNTSFQHKVRNSEMVLCAWGGGQQPIHDAAGIFRGNPA